MIPVIILLGIALAVSLAFNLGLIGGGAKPAAQASANTSNASKSESRSDDERARKAEAELEKKTKELSEVKKAQAELKDELKTAKKKLHDARESDKAGDDLDHADDVPRLRRITSSTAHARASSPGTPSSAPTSIGSLCALAKTTFCCSSKNRTPRSSSASFAVRNSAR